MARRGRKEGSIFKRGDGRWCGVVDLGWVNGKRRRKSFYGQTRANVAKQIYDAIGKIDRGLPVAFQRQTLAQFLDRWLDESVKPSVRPLTYEQYRQHVRLYINPALGAIELSKLSPQHVQALLNKLSRRGQLGAGDYDGAARGKASEDKHDRPLSPRTLQITLFVLRRALEQAVKWDLVARNVAKLVDKPRSEKKEIVPPTQEQVQTFLNVVRGQRLEAIFTVGFALGMRRGEVLGLRWEDVNFENRTLTVRQALQRNGGRRVGDEEPHSKLRFVPPKSARGVRTIAMPECVISALRAHRARQAEERLVAGPEWQDCGLVFTTRKGTPIEPRRLDTDFKKILDRTDLPRATRLHDSRHFAISLLAAQGVHPRTAMEIVGHSDINLTMNVYSHVVPQLMREAADKIDAALGGR